MVRRATLLCFLMILAIIPLGHCLEFVLGVKAGVGHFSYVGRDYQDYLDYYDLQNELKLGLVAGLFASIEITDSLIFHPEILLMRAGDAVSEPGNRWDSYYSDSFYGQVKYIDQLTYAAVPLLLGFRLGRIILLFGPTPMILMGNGKLLYKAEDDYLQAYFEYEGRDSREYEEDSFSSFALAAAAGLGIEFPAGLRGGVFLLEVRGHYIFTNVLGKDAGADLHAYGITVTAGYGLSSRGRDLRRSRIR
jgi:hypothetical protein